MKALTTYLTFDGTCREAMTFYAHNLGAELQISPLSDAPGVPPSDRVVHARVSKGTAQLMASDSMPGHPISQGFNFSVAGECESLQEIESLFTAFGAGGKITMPLDDMFWGARFGMLIDKFGIQWMFNFEKPKT